MAKFDESRLRIGSFRRVKSLAKGKGVHFYLDLLKHDLEVFVDEFDGNDVDANMCSMTTIVALMIKITAIIVPVKSWYMSRSKLK